MYRESFEILNEYQREAVVSMDKYALLNAQVGSGKTTVLVHKILYLNIVRGVSLDDIMVLTFTNKAAGEIIKRINIFEEEIKGDIKYVGTFHSVANKILQESSDIEELGYKKDFTVIDMDTSFNMLEEIINDSKLNVKYKAKVIKRIDEYKNGNSLYGVMKKEDDIGELLKIYNQRKMHKNLMDFEDIIHNCIKILTSPLNPKWIIVDEFQDTDLSQLELIEHMAGDDTSIFVIGDPNQIIYSFRRGTSDIFNNFKKLYAPSQFTLPINYRSTKTIVDAANSFIGKESIKCTNDISEPIIIKKHYDAFNEAIHIANKIKDINLNGVDFKDIAILHRRVSQGDTICSVLEKEGVPYIRQIKHLDDVDNVDNKGVNVLTMHASKGLEFSHVFITCANMGNIPITGRSLDEDEEARLFFVAMTRAKKYLEISYLTKADIPGVTKFMSPYITMIPDALKKNDDIMENITLKDIMISLRKEREKKIEIKKIAIHKKYGEGKVTFEDENIIKVEFENYGEKEFSKLFCPVEIKEL